MAKLTHSESCGKRALDSARSRFGTGWNLLSFEVKQMALDHEVMSLFTAQVIPVDCVRSFKDAWQHVSEARIYAHGLLDAANGR